MILNFHEYKQVWCYQTDFRPVRKELEGEKKKSGKETEKGKGPGWKWEEKGRWRKEYGDRGGGGGGGRKWINMSSLSNRLWGQHFQMNSLAYTGGGGGGWRMNLEFCRYIWILSLHWNFVRTPTKDIIVPTKYLWFTNRIWRRIACFRPKTTKLSARLAQTHSSFLRVSGSSVSSLRNKSTKTRTYCTDKICYFTNKILLTDWEELYVFDARVPKFRLARSTRSQSFIGFLEFLVFWLE